MNRLIITFITALTGLSAWCQAQLTNLPTIYIDTESHQAVTSKETYVKCKVTVEADDDAVTLTDREAGIRGRGNSTWGMAKKPFRLKFDKKLNFFNRPAKAKSWTLLANYADKTLMRNAVAFEISRFVGFDFSPTAVFVDLVLNGEYLGNYMVSDQMEVNKGRVDIDEMDATCIEGESLTGGYFLEIDGFGASEPVHFTTSKGLIITVKSPDDDVIQPQQIAYIKDYINKFERVLFGQGFDDPDTGFSKMVDVKSLVDWYICCELTGNSDSFWSTYVYKKRGDDHLYFGPLWDFDIAFNNDNRLGDAVNKLMRDNAHDPKTWIRRIWEARWFRQAVYDRWCQLRADGLEDFILDFIDATAQYLDESQALNFNKWRVLNKRVYLEQFLFNTYKGGVEYLRSYIHERIAFLDMSFRASGAVSVIDDIRDGEAYYLIHYVGLYGTPDVSNFYIRNPLVDAQCLTFVSTGTPGVWNIRTVDRRLLASKNGDKYCTYVNDGSDAHAQFRVEASPHSGYARIKNVYTGQYLGIEHTAHNSRVSTNKDGTATNHAWLVLPVNFTGISAVNADVDHLVYDASKDAVICDAPCGIYAISGQCVALTECGTELSTAMLPPGVYIARTATKAIKFVKN